MSKVIITNNPYVNDKYKDEREVMYKEDMDYLELLEFVRTRVHEGYELLTQDRKASCRERV